VDELTDDQITELTGILQGPQTAIEQHLGAKVA
jgi:hypothetical protein